MKKHRQIHFDSGKDYIWHLIDDKLGNKYHRIFHTLAKSNANESAIFISFSENTEFKLSYHIYDYYRP